MKRRVTPDHWSRHLRTWYHDAILAVRQTRPTFNPMPFEAIRWQVTGRASRKAGVTWPVQKRIWLHAAMTEEQALSTFRHELAHLWVFWYENESTPMFERRYGHGQQWRYWARLLGDDGDRCHDYAEVLATRRGDWAHCLGCKRERKQVWRHGGCQAYRCKRCRQNLRPGRLWNLEKVVAAITQPTVVAAAREVASDEREPISVRVRSLVLELGILKEGGLASSPEAKKIRVMLRKLDPEWRIHG